MVTLRPICRVSGRATHCREIHGATPTRRRNPWGAATRPGLSCGVRSFSSRVCPLPDYVASQLGRLCGWANSEDCDAVARLRGRAGIARAAQHSLELSARVLEIDPGLRGASACVRDDRRGASWLSRAPGLPAAGGRDRRRDASGGRGNEAATAIVYLRCGPVPGMTSSPVRRRAQRVASKYIFWICGSSHVSGAWPKVE